MTGLDRFESRPGARDGYWPSAWPAECGGNRRQKAATGRLDAAAGTATVAARRNGRWNVMFVEREPDQWYLGGTMPAFSEPEPYGWVERLDLSAGGAPAEALEPVARSPRLPCGSHVWCGSILAHAAQRLLRFSLIDDGHWGAVEPFGTPGGGIIAPPVHIPEVGPGVGMAVAWDSVNGGLAGVEVPTGTPSGEMTVAWQSDVRPSMQPVVYPESGELVINGRDGITRSRPAPHPQRRRGQGPRQRDCCGGMGLWESARDARRAHQRHRLRPGPQQPGRCVPGRAAQQGSPGGGNSGTIGVVNDDASGTVFAYSVLVSDTAISGVSLSNFTFTSATATFWIAGTDGTARTVYFRHRREGATAWTDASQTTADVRAAFTLTGLSPASDYTAQASFDSTFSDGTEVTVPGSAPGRSGSPTCWS